MNLFNPSYIIDFFPRIAAYIPVTLLVLFVSIFFSIIVGTGFYFIRVKKVFFVSAFIRVLISYIRGTPVITQLFLVYFSLPVLFEGIGINISRVPGIVFVVFTYAVYFGAAISENIRASLNSVGYDQTEACYSLGMSPLTALRCIIFPQMIVTALPNFVNIFVSALKNTSLAFSVGVIEMMSKAQMLGATYLHYAEAYISISIIYYIMYLIITYSFSLVEKRLRIYKRQNNV